MAKNRFYVVWQGRCPGVYSSWEACKKEVDGFEGAKYKGYPDRASADAAFAEGFTGFEKKTAPQVDLSSVAEKPVSPAIAVDAACAGNPGKMEYQGLFVDFGTHPYTSTQLFKSPVFENGTNNIGEFLAIVHALAWQKQKRTQYPIYSDSYNAQLWVRQKKCKTKLQPNVKNEYLFQLVARAEKWLNENPIEVPILKWKTEIWGEITADFGRK